MKYYILFFLVLFSFVENYSQTNKALEDLLLKGFSSEDSTDFYFKYAKKLVKTKADTANYLYFKFFRNDANRINDSARYYADKVIPLFEELDTLERLRKVYERMHYQKLREGSYEGALEYIEKALVVSEKMQDTSMISLHLSDKSNIYHDFEDYAKGVEFGKKAYQLMDAKKEKVTKYLIFANNVIAINFDDWNKPDSALYYHYKNVELHKTVEDSARYSFIFNNIGNTLLKSKKYKEAKKYINRSLVLNKIRGRNYNLATNYTNLATIAYEEGNYSLADQHFKEAYIYAEKSESIEKIRDVTQQEAWYYKKKGDYQKALERQEAFYVLKDSVFNVERAKKVAEMATKYETQKKEKEILQQRTLLAENELAMKKKNQLIFGSFGLAFILGLLGYLLVKQQKLKNSQIKRESELKTALVKIETQNKLQEQRLRISRDLHDNIGSHLTFIISSLDNLKYKYKDFPATENLDGISGFTKQTIYELRDTIWAMNKSDISFEDLQIRISNFIDQAKIASDGTVFKFNIAENVNKQHVFSSVEGMNLYRIIQEAINNASKYADADEISVIINESKTHFNIIINDNGKGFDMNKVEYGNGISNIKKRSKNMNGDAIISSEINKGTSIKIDLPK